MYTLVRTTSISEDFLHLIRFLDANLKENDGDEHVYYSQLNKVDEIRHVVICYDHQVPIGCGAFKKINETTAEIKRMFVQPNYRKKGVASKLLSELEAWAKTENLQETILETGVKQIEAVSLYYKNGYQTIPNFGPYVGMQNSICFKKTIPS